MGFIDSYKQLEKLCRDLMSDERNVTAYIEEMTGISDGILYVYGWKDDLNMLKRCRYIRNKIVHEPGCTEENMCTESDTQWIDNFYSRIMNQTDPLAMYRKAKLPKPAPQNRQRNSENTRAPAPVSSRHSYDYSDRRYENQNRRQSRQNDSPDGNTIFTALLVIAILIIAIAAAFNTAQSL